jgi:carbonic anhydrase
MHSNAHAAPLGLKACCVAAVLIRTMLRVAPLLLLALLAFPGCDRLAPAKAEPEKPAKKAVAAKATSKSKTKAKANAEHGEAHPDEPQRYIVPFAWEASHDEPLAQARAYFKEILGDNNVYMEHGPRFFAAFADGQKPRATVVTCSDSRVHTTAFDVTPENDDFMIRNIGNQVANGEGSVEYGIEHLETPVLLIMGHTGCGAVKAALGDTSKLSAPIRNELDKLSVPKPKAGTTPEVAWKEAVIANVHNQVLFALSRFGNRVREGKLTVVGAVYDFRDDLGAGAGKLSIVDVNGNAEPERMRAFLEAVESGGEQRRADPKDKDKHKPKVGDDREHVAKRPASPALGPTEEAVIDALGKIPGLRVQQPEKPEPTAQAVPKPHAAAVQPHTAPHGGHGH